ncbi:MAG: glycosyltransferase [candidate division WOR-3 bacterium]
MKNIAVFTTVHKIYDARIYHKEIKSLKKFYNIFLYNPYIEGEIKEEQNLHFVKLKKRNNRFLRILLSPIDTFLQLVKTNYDLYHFHDPELLVTGVLLKIFGKNVIYDSHENNYGLIMEKTYIKPFLLKFFIAKTVRLFEIFSSYFFDGVIVARPDLKKLYKNKNILIFRNFPDIQIKIETSEINKEREKPIIVYSGGLTYIRGILQLIDAVDLLDGKVELHLLGEWQDKGLKEECEKRNGYNFTKYLGNFPYGEHFKYIKNSDIGIVPFLPARNHLTTLPNKPFEYFLCKIPVLMSNFPYWKTTFKNMAIFFDPLSPNDIKEKILFVLENKDLSYKLVENAFNKLQTEFNWDKEKVKLENFYKSILKK